MKEVAVTSIKWMARSRIVNFPNSISIEKQSIKILADSTPIEEDEEKEENEEEEELIHEEVNIESVRDNDPGNFHLLQQELRRNNEFISNEIQRFEDGELVALRRDIDDGELGALEVVMNLNLLLLLLLLYFFCSWRSYIFKVT